MRWAIRFGGLVVVVIVAAILVVPRVFTASAGPAVYPDTSFPRLSVADDHVCEQFANGASQCWGGDIDRAGESPVSPVLEITAGGDSTCVLWRDHHATCHGFELQSRRAIPPSRMRLRSIAVGTGYVCGLAKDQQVHCWLPSPSGIRRKAITPSGTFTALSAGAARACALSKTASVTCWNPVSGGITAERGGGYIQISAGYHLACGLQSSGTVQCWNNMVKSPRGRFRFISAGNEVACGIRLNYRIACWGPESAAIRHGMPAGPFQKVYVDVGNACAIRKSDDVVCWGVNVLGERLVPPQDAVQVAKGSSNACILYADRHVGCLVGDADDPIIRLPGRYLAIDASRETPGAWCAVKTTGTVRCWTEQSKTVREWKGKFTSVTIAGAFQFCALSRTHAVFCHGVPRPVPSEQYKQISVGLGFACGVGTDNALSCWGKNDHGQTNAPTGDNFTEVSVGIDDACAVDLKHWVDCWGDDDNPATKPHKGLYASVALMPSFERGGSEDYACGLLLSGHISCWGFPAGTLIPPDGRFRTWDLGLNTLCGVTANGTARCNGEISFNLPGTSRRRTSA